MRVVITGGGGFLGRLVAARILAMDTVAAPSGDHQAVDELLLVDQVFPAAPIADDARIVQRVGDVDDEELVASLFDRSDVSVFHLAAMVSGQAEVEFDQALRVNLDGTRLLLEGARRLPAPARFVFASTLAVFGPGARSVGDDTKQTPAGTYGMTKAIGELLVNDYSRKGFVDGRSVRLPTVVVRPGASNRAASSFASAVVREPLAGVPYELPVSLDTAIAVVGYRTAAAGLVALHEADAAALGLDRAVALPSLTVTPRELLAAAGKATGRDLYEFVSVRPDPATELLVQSWPPEAVAPRALQIAGLAPDSVTSLIADYLQDFGPGPA